MIEKCRNVRFIMADRESFRKYAMVVKGRRKPHTFHIYGQRGSACRETKGGLCHSLNGALKFARGYLANGQIKGLVDNLWRFQSFNARHKTPITAEGESEDPREGSRSSSLSVAFGLF